MKIESILAYFAAVRVLIRPTLFIIGIVLVVVAFSNLAHSDHTDNYLLNSMQKISQGVCRVTQDNGSQAYAPCKKYLGRDELYYYALYVNGQVAVIKRMNEDGTQEDVYVRPESERNDGGSNL